MGGMKLNSIGISHHIHSVLLRWLRTDETASWVDYSTTADRMNPLP